MIEFSPGYGFAGALWFADAFLREHPNAVGPVHRVACLLQRVAGAICTLRPIGADDEASIQELLAHVRFRPVLWSREHRVDAELVEAIERAPITLQMEHDGELDDAYGVYREDIMIEGLIDLLVKSREPRFRLRKCYHDGKWFRPVSHAARYRFCCAACRNAFNYRRRVENVRFVCAQCRRSAGFEEFSGVAYAYDGVSLTPASFKHDHRLLCFDCVIVRHTEWAAYYGNDHLTGAVLLGGMRESA